MKQILLATALIALPVAAFIGYRFFTTPIQAGAQISAGIGDTSVFATIITDVQAFAAKGDIAAAKHGSPILKLPGMKMPKDCAR